MRNDRWANSTEIKRVLQADADKSKGGAVLYCNNGRHWKYTSEGNTIILGVTGSGKSRRGTIPMIRSVIEAEESFVVVDPKKEIYPATAPYLSSRYKKHVIDFRHIFESECCNILAAPAELFKSGDPEKKQVALEMIDDLAHALYPIAEKTEPFWQESARSTFLGAVYALLMYANYEEINIASVYQFIAKGEERFGGPGNNYMKEFYDELPDDSIAAMMLRDYISTATETRAGIRSSVLEGISIFAKSEGLISMMGFDDLHINQLDGETPTAIFVILPDETEIYCKVAGIIIGQLMGHYVRLAHDKYNGRLPRRCNFLVEEAGNVRINSLGQLMSAGRSRNIRTAIVLQSYSQLEMLYNAAEAATIRNNADVLVAFRTNNWDTLQELSHKCGERSVEENGQTIHEALIMPSHLSAMRTGQALVMISGATKFISWIPDYTEIFDCSKDVPVCKGAANRHHASTFDIKEYVKNIKRRQVNGMTESPGFNPVIFSTGSTIDAKIAELDAEIAELDAEEEAERRPISFVLERTGRNKGLLIKAIRNTTNVSSLKNAKKVLESLPHTFVFKSQEDADKARRAIIEAGGVISCDGDEQPEAGAFEVVLWDDGGRKYAVTMALKEATGMSIVEAIDTVAALPHPMKFTSIEEAKNAAELLKKAGGKVITFNVE